MVPTGPNVMVLPGQGKPFDQFAAEDQTCRQWAAQQSGASPSGTANQTAASGAVIGTAMGAGLGAAIGAASGLILGTAQGAGAAGQAGYTLQRRYDMSYEQCMYASGNQIPGVAPAAPARAIPPPPPPGWVPPPSSVRPLPPRGSPPPPPVT
jgi:hypothetical protein